MLFSRMHCVKSGEAVVLVVVAAGWLTWFTVTAGRNKLKAALCPRPRPKPCVTLWLKLESMLEKKPGSLDGAEGRL